MKNEIKVTSKKDRLLTFFMVSNAVFTMMRTVISAFGKNYTPSPMEVLHSMALKELENEGDPDWGYLDALLERMEGVAEENKNERDIKL